MPRCKALASRHLLLEQFVHCREHYTRAPIRNYPGLEAAAEEAKVPITGNHVLHNSSVGKCRAHLSACLHHPEGIRHGVRDDGGAEADARIPYDSHLPV